ncbi:MAG: 30S ribosomal protein S11 [SAR324 cluster bacterium]|uniref:30S ribosomal protein S11 n=1 Tax=marine metagenome TaxID=408172 RepID=A0A381W0B9_9ZZZZ|nr:30S ribosomal protein S11 [SAR324 cluster bacterium]|tara:strand:+ start:992 stop:1375 length:384 start_codon:yes stop_codon:yes gene_type:complete
MAQVKKRKVKRNVEQGRIYIKATFNNTIMTITDARGNAIGWSSTGVHGFKGSRKSTPFAARVAADDALKKAVESGMKSVDVFVKGPGSGRESALRAISAIEDMRITSINDITPVPHNGCRPPKQRRI